MKYIKNQILIGFGLLIFVNIYIYLSGKLTGYSLIWEVGLIIFLSFIFKILKTRTNLFYLGLNGENEINDELKKLGSDFVVLKNGLDTGKGNIDKVVIGPTGVWTLEVKSHKGNFTFDGQLLYRNGYTVNFLNQAYAEALEFKKIIKAKTGNDIYVNPVLVFSNKYAKVRLGLNKCNGVYVIQKAWLNNLITQPTHNILSDKEINTINLLLK